jgi:DNA-binding CsgD family transcriptional regulator/tetratricopeptide (TPR) repeat protein
MARACRFDERHNEAAVKRGREAVKVHPLGRDTELATIDRFLASTDTGPRALVIAGEAGIGRTTVWEDGVRRAHDRGWRVLRCRPGRTETVLAHSGLADVLEPVPEQVLAQLPLVQRHALEVTLLRREPGVPDQRRRGLGTAVLTLVRLLARAQPVLIAVDDVQWLDPQTAEVLGYLLRRLRDEPVAVLATVRAEPDEMPSFAFVQALADHRVARLWLGPLDPGALRRVVRSRTGVRLARPMLRRLCRSSGSNPFFAVEMARALARTKTSPAPGEPLPTPKAVADLVSQRLEPLPEPTCEALLYVAALCDPTLDLVRAALGAPPGRPSALTAAEENGVIAVDGDRIRFTHPLLGSGIYALASAERRRLAHRRLAETVHEPEQHAWHLALATAGTDERVAVQLDRAGETARLRGALAVAAQFCELAVRRTPAGRAAEARRRAVTAARCVFAAGDTARARDLLEAVVDDLPPGHERAHALSDLARVVFFEGSTHEASELCRRALEDANGNAQLRASLQLRRAEVATHDAPLQLSSARKALLLGRQGAADDPDLLSSALVATATYRYLNGGPVAWDDLTCASRLSARSSPAGRARQALGAWARFVDPPGARELFAAEYQHALERGDEASASHSLTHLSEMDCRLGDWHRAADEATAAVELIEQTGQHRWLSFGLHSRALVAAHRGEADVATTAAEHGLRLARAADDPYASALHRQVLGFLELSRGDLDAADRHLSLASELVESMGVKAPAGFTFHGDRVEVAVGLDQLDTAARLSGWLAEQSRIAPRPWLVVLAARAEAAVRQAEGGQAAAEAAAERAVRACQQPGMLFELGRALLVQGRIRRAGRQRRAAGESLAQARDIFERLGAALWAAQATAELSRCGQRRVAADELSPTEERVASLVASGLSNREVAAAAYISVKTVEANLSRIYRKVGVRNRRELARTVVAGFKPSDSLS